MSVSTIMRGGVCRKRQRHLARSLAFLLAAVPGTALPMQAVAQDAPASSAATNDIVVTARRSGAPMWEVVSGTGTLLLVGEIQEVPKATPWRPERLEAATARAQRVILGTKAKVGVSDLFRLIFKGGRLKRLPEGRTAADYLTLDEQRRLAAVVPADDRDWPRRNLLITAFDLLTKQARFNKDTTDDATDVVRRAARRAHISTQPVGTVRGKELLDSLFEATPQTHLPCLRAAIAAAENGPEGAVTRGRDWTQFDVPGVMSSPLEDATARCWPWGDGGSGDEVRRQWSGAVAQALTQPGVTLAVVPLRLLAEEGGVLDRLKARGVSIKGPAWRTEKAS